MPPRRSHSFTASGPRCCFLRAAGPAAAQRGGDDGAYQILSARFTGTSRRYVDVTERVRRLANGDQPFLVHNDTFEKARPGPRENTAH